MRSKFILFGCLGLFLVRLYAQDYGKELLGIIQLADAKKYPEAIAGYEKFLTQAPESLRGAVQFEIATLQAAQGDKDRALQVMEQAIGSGFDDCLALEQYKQWDTVRNDPRFQELRARVRISEADRKELFWLKAEIQNVHHDTKMMITENVNRMDTGITVIPQSTIPARVTSSSAVLFNRELLKMMHLVQRDYVFRADKARMEHVTRMTIISGATSYERALQSSRLAALAAEERKRAIDARKFSLPPGAGTTPLPCSAGN